MEAEDRGDPAESEPCAASKYRPWGRIEATPKEHAVIEKRTGLQREKQDFQEALRLTAGLVIDVVASDEVVPGRSSTLLVSVINGGRFNFPNPRVKRAIFPRLGGHSTGVLRAAFSPANEWIRNTK